MKVEFGIYQLCRYRQNGKSNPIQSFTDGSRRGYQLMQPKLTQVFRIDMLVIDAIDYICVAGEYANWITTVC